MPSLTKPFRRLVRGSSNASTQVPPTAAVEHPHGLEVVYEGPEASLDIVAVHGLNGHREKTWTAANGVHWLRDLLPKDLPGIRVLTWGYDANTHSQNRVSCQSLYDHAPALVSDLTRKRTLTQSFERPIIFVAHSLGGIVVKSALIHSDAARQGALPQHRSVKTSTYGVVYIGTPHQGGSGNGVQLGRALVNVASIFTAADNHILKHLEGGSEWLQQQLSQYNPISNDFVTKFAYEEYKTPTILGHEILVVPKASAVVPGQADAEPIPIPADHINMVKFSFNTNSGYNRISESLQIMAKGAGEKIRSRWETEARVVDARGDNISQFTLPLDLSHVVEVPCFVAREQELSQMNAILGKSGERQTVILHGLGGMGKTQLAREYIRRHRTDFSAAIWLNAKDTMSLRQSFERAAQLISRHHPSVVYVRNAIQNRDLEKCVEAVKRWLDEPKNDRWAVVYDNYDNPQLGFAKPINVKDKNSGDIVLAAKETKTFSNEELVAQQGFDIRLFLPNTFHGAVIITTRSSHVKLGNCIRITKFTDRKNSIEILASTSRREGLDQDADADRLAERLDGLPLALATAGAYLEGVPSTTLIEYLEMYDQSWLRLQENTPPILSYEDRAMYSTWNISYTHIERQNPASARLLRLWAYFDNEDLWYELLFEGTSSNGDSNTGQYLEGVADDKMSFNAAIRVLHDYGLVEPDTLTNKHGRESQGYSMHGCVHSWTQYVLNACLNGARLISMTRLALQCVGEHVPREDVEEYWLIRRRLLKHADRCRARMKEGIELDDADEWLYGALGLLYADQGRYADAEEMCERALRGNEKALGPQHESTLRTVNNLGMLYRIQGRHIKAEEMYKRALQDKETALGPEHTSTLETVNNLGILYACQGQHANAEKMYERALQGYRALEPEHTSTLNTVNNLGVLYMDQGRHADAEKLYKQALQGYEKALGPEHTSTLETVNNLGVLYMDQGRHADAKKMYERALQGYKKALGPEHTSTLITINYIGLLYADKGQHADAKEMYERALQGYKKVLGPEHTITLETVNNLGLLYADKGQHAEAEAMYERALQGYEKAWGASKMDNYIPVLKTLRNLGSLFYKLGDKEKARMYFLRARSGCQTVFGPSSDQDIEFSSWLELCSVSLTNKD
ncbi:hypothetical protein HD806DRAFT_540135 [Xylariaceae sp. AK1471]|nr:hypothetical protein HD806DRAFT_540135 [Xylariaceae sp. AK1471]